MNSWQDFQQLGLSHIHRFLTALQFKQPSVPKHAAGSHPDQPKILENFARIMPDCFGWITNVQTRKITWSTGLFRHMGYTDSTFSLPQSIATIHPDFRWIICQYAFSLYEVSQQAMFRFDSRAYLYRVEFPMMDHRNQAWMVTRTSQPYELDEEGRLISNLNWFQKTVAYNGDIPKIRLNLTCEHHSTTIHEQLKSFHQQLANLFVTEGLFTRRELEVLRAKHRAVSIKKLEDTLDIDRETVKSHCRHALYKARNRFPSLNLTTDKLFRFYTELGILDP
jgi:DNA-binding CsgD family transcriptional regulator